MRQPIDDIITDLKNITLSCIKDVDSEDIDGLEAHIEKRAAIIEMLKLSEESPKHIGELLKANEIYDLDKKLTKIVVSKKQDIHSKIIGLTQNNNASRKYKTSQMMTNVFFNTKR